MKIEISYEEAMISISQRLAKIPDDVGRREDSLLRELGKALAERVEKELPISDDTDGKTTRKNYNGSTPYVHMKDDVRSSIAKGKDGTKAVVVRGGKNTGYKWHLVNDDHMDRSGKSVPGTAFIEKAIVGSEVTINKLIDDFLEEVLTDI